MGLSLKEFSVNLKKLIPSKIEEIRISSLNQSDVVIRTKQQLEDGKRGDGFDLPKYKPLTIKIKQETGGFISPSGKIALKDTGAFHKGIQTVQDGNILETFSTDSKEAKLIAKYGEDILKLTDANEKAVFDNSEENYSKNINGALGL